MLIVLFTYSRGLETAQVPISKWVDEKAMIELLVEMETYIGGHAAPHWAATKRIITITQNKYPEPYGSRTTRDLKKRHSSRQAGGAESQRLGVVWRGGSGSGRMGGLTFMCGR